jgi:thioredoxin-related protein
MKRILSGTLILLTSILTLHAQSGMNFIKEDWTKALADAKAQQKYIVLDAYTEWCGWCKVMDKNTFNDSSVAAYYSANFIAIKIDMEKGVGIDLAMKYRVSAFPSILYFDPEGRLVYRTVGYRKVEPFLADGAAALDPKTQFRHPGDPLQLDPGFPQFYKDSFRKGKERKWAEQSVVDEFLSSQEDLFSEVSWSVMSRFALSNNMISHFLNNKAKYTTLYGSVEVEDKVSDIVYAKVQSSIKNSRPADFDEAIRILKAFSKPADTAGQVLAYSLHYYKETANWKDYTALATRAAQEAATENAARNQYAWTIFENVDDKAALNAAREWMKKVVADEPLYAYIDTYAALLYKLGQNKEAEKQALRAIEVGTAANEDVEGTRELLLKINKK